MTKGDLFGGEALRRLSTNAYGELAVDASSETARLRTQCYELIRRSGLRTDHHRRKALRHLVNSRNTVQELREVRTMIKRATTIQ